MRNQRARNAIFKYMGQLFISHAYWPKCGCYIMLGECCNMLVDCKRHPTIAQLLQCSKFPEKRSSCALRSSDISNNTTLSSIGNTNFVDNDQLKIYYGRVIPCSFDWEQHATVWKNIHLVDSVHRIISSLPCRGQPQSRIFIYPCSFSMKWMLATRWRKHNKKHLKLGCTKDSR